MPVSSPYLIGTDRYERHTHGWVDVARSDAFSMTVRLADPWVSVELVAEASPSPDYRLLAVRGRLLVGDPERVDPALEEAAAKLAGLRMVRGFTRNATEVLGSQLGAPYLVDAAIEVARLARQVTRLPEDVVRARSAEGPAGFWHLDMQGWVDIPSSCYTFRPESEALFRQREVTCAGHAGLYAPPVGATRVFNRTKATRLQRRDDRLLMAHSMFDEVHSFQVWYHADLASGVIVDAGSVTPRLPYLGICTDPQGKIASLIGQPLGPQLRRRIGVLIGGLSGCAQLYDLTADLLKLLRFD